MDFKLDWLLVATPPISMPPLPHPIGRTDCWCKVIWLDWCPTPSTWSLSRSQEMASSGYVSAIAISLSWSHPCRLLGNFLAPRPWHFWDLIAVHSFEKNFWKVIEFYSIQWLKPKFTIWNTEWFWLIFLPLSRWILHVNLIKESSDTCPGLPK